MLLNDTTDALGFLALYPNNVWIVVIGKYIVHLSLRCVIFLHAGMCEGCNMASENIIPSAREKEERLFFLHALRHSSLVYSVMGRVTEWQTNFLFEIQLFKKLCDVKF